MEASRPKKSREITPRGVVSAGKIAILTLIAVATAAACAPQQAPEPSMAPQAQASPDPAKHWLGKDVADLEQQLGTPTSVITLQGNRRGGGKLILYANPGQPHMIFETAPGSQTINKALTVE